MTPSERPRRAADGRRKPTPAAKAAAPTVLKLTAANLDTLGRANRLPGELRPTLLEVITEHQQLTPEGKEAVRVLLGRLARSGRDLASPLEITRHRMLQYMERILCGLEFKKKDPQSRDIDWKDRLVYRLVGDWKRQLEHHLEKNPALRLSVSEAMGLPPDEDEARARSKGDGD